MNRVLFSAVVSLHLVVWNVAEDCPFACKGVGSGSTWSGERIYVPLLVSGDAKIASFPIYSSSYPTNIVQGNTTISSVQIAIAHNTSESQSLFCTLVNSKPFASQAERSLLLVLQFLTGTQIISPTCPKHQNRSNVLTWPSTVSWSAGYSSYSLLNERNASSFDVLDSIVKLLSDKFLFPSVNTITFLGFGSGAEAIMRFMALKPQVTDSSEQGTTLRFVIVNPGTYVYDDLNRVSSYLHGSDTRNTIVGGCAYSNVPATITKLTDAGVKSSLQYNYSCECPFSNDDPFPSLQNCPNFNAWPYGLDKDSLNSLPYTVDAAPAIFIRSVALNVIFVLATSAVCYCPSKSSEIDEISQVVGNDENQNMCLFSDLQDTDKVGSTSKCEDGNLDQSCAAMAQGVNRLQRGLNFLVYGYSLLLKHFNVMSVPKSYRWMAISSSKAGNDVYGDLMVCNFFL